MEPIVSRAPRTGVVVCPLEEWDPRELGADPARTRDVAPPRWRRALQQAVRPRTGEGRTPGAVFVVLVGRAAQDRPSVAYDVLRDLFPARLLARGVDVDALADWLETLPDDADPVVWLGQFSAALSDAGGRRRARRLGGLFDRLAGLTVVGELGPAHWDMFHAAPAHRQQDLYEDVRALLGRAVAVHLAGERHTGSGRPAGARPGRGTTVAAHTCATAAADAVRLGRLTPLPAEALMKAAVCCAAFGEQPRPSPEQLREGPGEARAAGWLMPGKDDGGWLPTESFAEHTRVARATALVAPDLWDVLLEHTHDPMDLLRLGLSAERRGLLRHAFLFYGRAADEGSTLGLRRLAHRTERTGHPDRAETLLRRAGKLGDACAEDELVGLLERRGRPAEAEELLRHAYRTGRRDVLFALVGLLERTQREGPAEALLESAGRAGDARALLELSRRLRVRGRLVEAECHLRRAVEGGDCAALVGLVGFLDGTGRRDEADVLLQEAAGEGAVFACLELSRRLRVRGRLVEAERHLRQAAETGDPDALVMLAGLCLSAGREDEARECLVRAADLGEPAALYKLARMGCETTDRERAARTAALVGDGFARYELARIFEQSGRHEESHRVITFGLEPSGETAQPW